jgi:predicted nucleic acid-binding protein
MMTDVLLLDAGVWVATVISDERFELASRELLADASRTIGSLDLTLYEVANAVGSKRGKLGTAVSVCRTVERRCRQTMVRIDSGLIESTIEVASAYGLTAYDATYVAVARRHDWTLVSTDIRDLVSKGLAITPDAAV